MKKRALFWALCLTFCGLHLPAAYGSEELRVLRCVGLRLEPKHRLSLSTKDFAEQQVAIELRLAAPNPEASVAKLLNARGFDLASPLQGQVQRADSYWAYGYRIVSGMYVREPLRVNLKKLSFSEHAPYRKIWVEVPDESLILSTNTGMELLPAASSRALLTSMYLEEAESAVTKAHVISAICYRRP